MIQTIGSHPILASCISAAICFAIGWIVGTIKGKERD